MESVYLCPDQIFSSKFMKNISPAVSIIMPMRNAEAYVQLAINSILSQSCHELELLVIDDQSTDQSRAIVEEIMAKDGRLKLLSGKAKGIAVAKNKCLAEALGQVVMFCDSDDYFADTRVESQLNWLNNHPDVGAICAGFAMIDRRGKNSVTVASGDVPCEITEELLSGKTRTHLCTFAIRSEFIQQIGGFREFFISAEDIDFQLRLAEVCKVFYDPEVVYFYRLHNSSITHTQNTTKRVFYEEAARNFRQQRIAKGEDDLQIGNIPTVPEGLEQSKNPNAQLQGVAISSAWLLHKQNKKLEAIKKGFYACLIQPFNFMVWKSFIMLIIK
jgi:glycosyltransferase involved in cell wall biosynthesis